MQFIRAEMLIAVENELVYRNFSPNDIFALKKSLIEAEEIELSEGREATFPQQFLGWVGIFA